MRKSLVLDALFLAIRQKVLVATLLEPEKWWYLTELASHLDTSPLKLADAKQFNGWQQLHDSYMNGYPDRSAMGFIQPKRIQVKLLKQGSPFTVQRRRTSRPAAVAVAKGS